MPRTLAILPIDLNQSRLGLASMLDRPLAGRNVLAWTLTRLSQIPLVDEIVLVHPSDQNPRPLLAGLSLSRPVHLEASDSAQSDPTHALRITSRKWALTAWRGGLAGATVYDELLPAGPLWTAAQKYQAQAILLAGGDWPLIDPNYCQRALELHLENPQAMSFTFCQAPPGLAGVAMSADLLRQLAENIDATFSQLLRYNPTKAQADPIGRDVCVQIPAPVRSLPGRFIYDTPRSAALIDALASQLGDQLPSADASAIAALAGPLLADHAANLAPLPQQFTLELTPRRLITGPIAPQHHLSINRPDLNLDLALQLVQQIAQQPDSVLTLGGLGDPLLHPQWETILQAARSAGVWGLALETDLIIEQDQLERLLAAPLDLLIIRLNADTAQVYQQLMGVNEFGRLVHHLEWFFNQRNRQAQAGTRPLGMPWMATRFSKTRTNLPDMDNFYDRWLHYIGHAIIDSPTTGCDLMPDLALMNMAPPQRFPCRQLRQRMTIHSDGQVPLCDQDWLARASVGQTADTPLEELWKRMNPIRQQHQHGQWNQLNLCKICREWHRP